MTFFGIGMRTIKTGLSVFIILIICGTFSSVTGIQSTGFYGGITAIICMQQYSSLTYQMGVERVTGSFIGAVVALALYTLFGIPSSVFLISFVVIVGIILAIHFTNILKIPFGSSVAAIMVVACFTVVPENAVVITTIVRCLETILGVVVVTLVNNYIAPYKPEES